MNPPAKQSGGSGEPRVQRRQPGEEIAGPSRDEEISPDPVLERDGRRMEVGTARPYRWARAAEAANWTAVVAGHLPLGPSPARDPFDLGPEFPTIRIVESELDPDVDERAWFSRAFDFWAFDRTLDDRSGIGFYLTIRTSDPDGTLPKVLTRCQRLFDRRNACSGTSRFDRILAAHGRLHDLDRPVVRADYDHALDVWQWVLRLDPDAGEEPQVAALFHDVDRLVGESRIEKNAADYARFREDHAQAGAWIAEQVLGAIGMSSGSIERVCGLIAGHEAPGEDPDAMLINEADALSFFSFSSPGFFDYFDPDHCRRKTDLTLARLSARGRSLLRTIFLRPDVEVVVREAGGLP